MELVLILICVYLVYRYAKSKSQNKHTQLSPAYSPPLTLNPAPQSQVKRPDKAVKAKWYGAGQAVNIKNYSISDGLIYVGTSYPGAGGYENDACLINPDLKVSPAEPWEFGEEMGYWPRYASISPSCRGAYLKWLAAGRSEPETYIGLCFSVLLWSGATHLF